jgi:hypothetical protein
MYVSSKFDMWVAYIKMQLVIATQMSVVKVNVTVAKNINSDFTQYFEFALTYWWLWPIDTRLALKAANIKMQLRNAT